MFKEVLEALQSYARGEVGKGEFTRLELLLARLRQNSQFDPSTFEDVLVRLVQSEDVNQEDFALGIALIAEKTGCYGAAFRDELERRLFASDDTLSARSQFELAMLYISSGGDFAPHYLDQLSILRSEKPELWLDLALYAYPRDIDGLLTAICKLFLVGPTPLHWSSFKPRYLKLLETVTTQKFNAFIKSVAKHLDANEGQELLNWVNDTRGSQLTLRDAEASQGTISAPLIGPAEIDFLTGISLLAQRVQVPANG